VLSTLTNNYGGATLRGKSKLAQESNFSTLLKQHQLTIGLTRYIPLGGNASRKTYKVTFMSQQMAISCPQCGESVQSVTLVRGRACYCARCGWNSEIVEKQLRGSIIGVIIAGTLGVMLAAALFLRTDPVSRGFAPAILVASVPLSVFNVVMALRHLRRLRGQRIDLQRT
jgi:uncharacterized protein (DUF983 family)